MKELNKVEIEKIISDGAKELANRLADKLFQFLGETNMSEFYGLTDRLTDSVHRNIILNALILLPDIIKSKLEKK